MVSDSATALATQQSTKAYVDTAVAGAVTKFTSSEVTYVAADNDKFQPHFLGAIPDNFSVVLRCKTTEGGYAVNDEIELVSSPQTQVGNSWVDATNVGYSSTNGFNNSFASISTKTGGGAFVPTPANWVLVFRAQIF